MITKELLDELLEYKNGELHWKVNRPNGIKQGAIAGWVDHKGYRRISVKNKTYSAHRLVWLHFNGHFPDKGFELDHINRNRSDNRIENLRLATHLENMFNSQYDNITENSSSGERGVFMRVGKTKISWEARAQLKGKSHHLGSYNTKEEAKAAYEKFAKGNQGEFYCQKVRKGE